MLKKNTRGLLAVATLLAVTVVSPAMAQEADRTGSGDGTSAGATTGNERRDDNSNWGWLGLLGLAGLAGLRRPAPAPVVREEREGNARVY